MNIALFGGTFDPIHCGHAAVAQVAKDRFHLARIHFVPANLPPHKPKHALAPFVHRYAMVALATAQQNAFLPSLLEAPETNLCANYSIDTLRRLKKTLKKGDRLFLLMGIDAFREITTWHEAEALFEESEFIVASRPGYSLADVAQALPEKLRPLPAITRPFHQQPARGDLVLRGATVHLLESVHHDISASKVRQAIAEGKSLRRYLDPMVAAYIRKMGLYRPGRSLMTVTSQTRAHTGAHAANSV